MKAIPLLILVALTVALAIAGASDYEESQAQLDEYCENVAAGVWPPYNGVEHCE